MLTLAGIGVARLQHTHHAHTALQIHHERDNLDKEVYLGCRQCDCDPTCGAIEFLSYQWRQLRRRSCVRRVESHYPAQPRLQIVAVFLLFISVNKNLHDMYKAQSHIVLSMLCLYIVIS